MNAHAPSLAHRGRRALATAGVLLSLGAAAQPHLAHVEQVGLARIGQQRVLVVEGQRLVVLDVRVVDRDAQRQGFR
jgi:hypothetical protein